MELTKTSQLDELIEFIKGKTDSRELKRALAAKLALEEYAYPKIQSILKVSAGFISKWKTTFLSQGIEGLLLKYKGAKPLLNAREKQAILEWLKQKDYWDLQELYSYILVNYQVSFKSKQSYYNLFKAAGIRNEKVSEEESQQRSRAGQKKKEEITEKLVDWKEKINQNNLTVFLVDECHLLWGDICGYIWGKTSERIEVPMTNQKQKQTYYGALNYQTKKFLHLRL